MEQRVSWKKVIMLAGAFCAFWIGSGFATGQEALQYAAAHGWAKGWATAFLYTAIVSFYLYVLYGVGQKMQFKNPYNVMEYYCGKPLGAAYTWFSVILTYGTFIVMLAGGGSAISEYYGLSLPVGTGIIALLAFGTAVLGVERLLNVIGLIGPVKIVFILAIGLLALGPLFRDPSILMENSRAIQEAGFITMSGSWVWSAVLWAMLGLMYGAVFFVMNGATCATPKEAKFSGILGMVGVLVVNLVLVTSEIVKLDVIIGQQVPMLAIARDVAPILAAIFAPILILCIYSAVASLLLVATRKLAVDRTPKFNILALVLAVVGFGVSTLLPFDRLMNILYPISGWVAIPLILLIIYKEFINKKAFPFVEKVDETAVDGAVSDGTVTK